ncbi:MAG: hypothetical protein Faunusvirus3_19 [Faunusvirus sp.]|jgi:hypothetical protein|uniref:Uncharacterized protein n=1 Tax=Faunusvirus sp. TaxID=2487766 RepID=A0A3G5A0Q1_9VIRU|nr:MAG: hypothetical protein Faunusvirus3_19 [Faunusvirus sp.]
MNETNNTTTALNDTGEQNRATPQIKPKRYDVKCLDCDTIPSFALFGDTAIYCKKHAEPNMVDVNNKHCIKCDTQSSYGLIGDVATHCKQHAEPDMINVVSKRCVLCDKHPTFGLIGDAPSCCSEHAKPNMIDVKHKKCIACDKIPYFGLVGDAPTHCKTHADPNMIDVKNKHKCLKCNKQPNFGLPGDAPSYCIKHAKPNMINVNSKRCDDNGCKISVRYGIPGNNASKCATHKKKNMIANPKTKCISDGCKEIALYGTNKKQQHCEGHRAENEINLIERECTSCKLSYILNKDNLCYNCDSVNGIKMRLRKQNQIKAYLDQNKFEYVSCDKMIDDGDCDKMRPDFLFDCGTHFLILEVDEDQHKSRLCECEITRMMNIANILYMPVIFIRYNPDEYKIGDEKIDPTFFTRIKELHKYLKHYMKPNTVEKFGMLSVIYIYYNNYDKTKAVPQTLIGIDKL